MPLRTAARRRSNKNLALRSSISATNSKRSTTTTGSRPSAPPVSRSHTERREIVSLGGRPPHPRLLLDPLERSVEPLRGATGPGEAAYSHLVDALPDDDRWNRGGEAPLKLERRRVRRMRRDPDGGDDIVDQGDRGSALSGAASRKLSGRMRQSASEICEQCYISGQSCCPT
jgi:hypothetical protein